MKKSNCSAIKSWLYAASVLALFTVAVVHPTHVSASTESPELSANANSDLEAVDVIDEVADLEPSVDETVPSDQVLSDDLAATEAEVPADATEAADLTAGETTPSDEANTTAATDVPDFSNIGVSVNDIVTEVFVDGDMFSLRDLVNSIFDEYGVEHTDFFIWTYDANGNIVFTSDSNVWYLTINDPTLPDFNDNFMIAIHLYDLDLSKPDIYTVLYSVTGMGEFEGMENLLALSTVTVVAPAPATVEPVVSDDVVVQEAVVTEEKLPKTGDAASSTTMLITGVIALLAAVVFAFVSKKRN